MSDSQEEAGRPIARPAVLSSDSGSRRSDGPNPPLTAGTTHSTNGAARPAPDPLKPRSGRRVMQAIHDNLAPRDFEILRSIAAHRYLTTRHIEALHFSGHASPLGAIRSVNRVLKRLSGLRLISHLDRRVGGIRAGSSSFVWSLAATGDRLLQAETGDGVRRRQRDPSARFLDHILAVADIHVALVQASGTAALELVTVQIEPGSWRRFLGLGGESRLLRPDLAVVTAQGEYEDHWFIEADLASEHPPTVVRKCRLYEDYRASGVEQETHGLFPRVLWAVPDQVRADRLTAAIRSARLDQDLFRVTTVEQLVPAVIGGAA
jgi:hypothetical protein